MNSRLSTIDPDIEKILDAMSGTERLALVHRIILSVADEVGIDSCAIEKSIEEKNHARLQETAQELDNRYFELQELDDPEYLAYFSKARCYSAAAFLAQSNIYEAIYEAVSASDTPQNIFRILKGEPCS